MRIEIRSCALVILNHKLIILSNQPIYATLSDIVVYSPKGASPAAIALARKFRAAMKSKREERTRAAAAASSCIGGGEFAFLQGSLY